MTLTRQVVDTTIRGITSLLCRIDDSQLAQVPAAGPLIIVANHINFLDAPVVVTRLQPRPVTGFAKVETWDNPVMAFLFDTWDAIPVRRGAADMTAFRNGVKALKSGKILAISPEGTRSNDGRLQKGHPGVTKFALLSGAPLLPVAYYGGEKYRQNLPRLRRTDFIIKVGKLFYLDEGGVRVNRQIRQQMTDEIMYQIAALLPPFYRGEYVDLTNATQTYLRFPSVSKNQKV